MTMASGKTRALFRMHASLLTSVAADPRDLSGSSDSRRVAAPSPFAATRRDPVSHPSRREFE
jgi:hypothetical protein